MENTNIDFAQALIEDLQEDNLFDLGEETLVGTNAVKTIENEIVVTEHEIIELPPETLGLLEHSSEQSLNSTKSAVEPNKNSTEPNTVSLEFQPKFQTEVPKAESTEDYKKAISEISSLKTIEQILYGVEHDIVQINTIPYDTVAINMALLGFQKGSGEDEERVYSEIEKWQCHLLDRDEQISLKDLRLYCETTKLKLSSRAMLTLAGFYQNVSKPKFEMLLTRTFSQADEESERRHLFCDHEEISRHINEVSFESNDENLGNKITVLKKFGDDVEEFESINGMLATDYFGRYQNFKQELGELYFDNKILGLVVRNNVIIGNRFVTLIEKEKANVAGNSLINIERFGASFEEMISEVIGKTIDLDKIKVDVAKSIQRKTQKQLEIQQNKAELLAKNEKTRAKKVVAEQDDSGSGKIIKMILLCVVLTSIIVGVGYFMLGSGLKEGEPMSEADVQRNESNKNDQ
jgi:hypothetical protein